MASRIGKFRDHDIYEGDGPLTDMVPILREWGVLAKGKITDVYSPTIEEEEIGIAKQSAATASEVFERNRQRVIAGLRAIVGHTIERFKLPTNSGLDIGSGATGAMVEDMLAPFIDKRGWIQMDINPEAVAKNKQQHPKSQIIEGSYLQLADTFGLNENLELITGLSSLDATQHLERAVSQIRKALLKGGYLFHIQDVRPGVGTGIREMQHIQATMPYNIEFITAPGTTSDVLTYRTPEGIFDVGELFRRNLGRAIEQDEGMELVYNQWVTSQKELIGAPKGHLYFLNLFLEQLDPVEEVSAIVTLARKKG